MKKKFIARAATAAAVLLMASGLVGCQEFGTKMVEVAKGFGISTGGTGATGVAEKGMMDALEGHNGIRRPEVITVMADTCITKENGLDDVCKEYEKQTGIKLRMEKPDHNQYYEKVNLNFAAGTVFDVIEMGGTYYPNYASSNALWDMSEAWESSALKATGKVDETYVDALKVPGKDGESRLYGFPMAKGGGTVTYVRGDWMEALGIENPTTYDEFLDMLRKFKNEIKNDSEYQKALKKLNIIPLTAAGLINSETPYNIYLPEFYQDANPDFYIPDGQTQYVDGMLQPEMKAALQRMKDAYDEGLIDVDVVSTKTSEARDRFNADRVGCFNYWAGSWNRKLQDSLEAGKGSNYAGDQFPGDVVPLVPFTYEKDGKNVQVQYIERPPTALVINSAYSGIANDDTDERQKGIFEYFVLYSHDGGEGQLLFTRGVEGIHWKYAESDSEKKTGIMDIPSDAKQDAKDAITKELKESEKSNEETGETREYKRVSLLNPEGKDKLVEKSFFSPELNIVDGYDEYEGMYINDKVKSSLDVFYKYNKIAPVPRVSNEMSKVLPDLTLARREAIAAAVTGKMSIDDAIKDYEKTTASARAVILSELNK
jgi:putative aldouronate transport system substrate-binding protein